MSDDRIDSRRRARRAPDETAQILKTAEPLRPCPAYVLYWRGLSRDRFQFEDMREAWSRAWRDAGFEPPFLLIVQGDCQIEPLAVRNQIEAAKNLPVEPDIITRLDAFAKERFGLNNPGEGKARADDDGEAVAA